MKKVLEDELMSLAHRILKLKNRAEIHELKEQAAVLYEKLSVLSFAEKHFEGVRPTIRKYDVVKSIESEYTKAQNDLNYPDGTEYNEDQIYEHNTEKIKDIVSQMPYESGQVDELFDDTKKPPEDKIEEKPNSKPQNDFQDFGVHFDDLPDFEPASSDSDENIEEEDSHHDEDKNKDVKNHKEENQKEKDSQENNESKSEKDEIDTSKNNDEKDKKSDEKPKPQRTLDLFSQSRKSLNDSLNNTLKIGLNDRLSFVNQLFQGDTEAYENFIIHINTLQNLEEAKSFLNKQIQDKYSYWKDKEDIANRLLNLIEKKFE